MTEHTADRQLRERARAVIPGGMYGHQSAPIKGGSGAEQESDAGRALGLVADRLPGGIHESDQLNLG